MFDVPWLSFVCSQIKTEPAIIFFHVVIKKAMVTSSRSGKPSVIKPSPKQRKQVKASNAMKQFKENKEMKKRVQTKARFHFQSSGSSAYRCIWFCLGLVVRAETRVRIRNVMWHLGFFMFCGRARARARDHKSPQTHTTAWCGCGGFCGRAPRAGETTNAHTTKSVWGGLGGLEGWGGDPPHTQHAHTKLIM